MFIAGKYHIWLKIESFVVSCLSSINLRAASERPLRATWAKKAAPTWLAASLRSGRWSSLNEARFRHLNVDMIEIILFDRAFEYALYIVKRSKTSLKFIWFDSIKIFGEIAFKISSELTAQILDWGHFGIFYEIF